MATSTPKRVTYVNPSLPLCGPMTGWIEHDDWEGVDLFFPDEPSGDRLLSLYGYEPEAGLSLDGAVVTPLP